jgi:hypothetical protein
MKIYISKVKDERKKLFDNREWVEVEGKEEEGTNSHTNTYLLAI